MFAQTVDRRGQALRQSPLVVVSPALVRPRDFFHTSHASLHAVAGAPLSLRLCHRHPHVTRQRSTAPARVSPQRRSAEHDVSGTARDLHAARVVYGDACS